MMLAGFNPNQIEDIEGAREAILHLLNLIETLKSENDRLRDENQRLRDEVNRLKGEQGKPNIKAKHKRTSKQTSTNYSSEQERRQPSERRKRRKNDEIKIDRAFVSELHQEQDESEQAMIMTILNMAKMFKLTTVAEGVETEEQFDILSNQQCKIFQGFYFSKALPKVAFQSLYLENL